MNQDTRLSELTGYLKAIVPQADVPLDALMAFFDALPVGVAISTDRECRTIRSNRILAEWLHLPPESNVSKSAPPSEVPNYRVLDAGGREMAPVDMPMQVAAARGVAVTDVELQVAHAGGQVIWLLGQAIPLQDPAGAVFGSLAVYQDVTRSRQAEARTAALQAVTAALSAALTQEQIAEAIIDRGLPALGASTGTVLRLAENGDELEIVRASGFPEGHLQRWQRIPLSSPVGSAEVARTRQMLLIGSRAELEARVPASAAAYPDGYAGGAVPLLAGDRLVGVLGFNYAADHAFSAEERTFILALAQQCAQALDRARLYEAEQAARREAERTAERMARLQSVTAALSQSLTPAQVAEAIVRQGVAALGAQGGVLARLTTDGSELELLGTDGYAADTVRPWARIPISLPVPLTEAARTGEVVLVSSLEERGQRYPALASVQTEYQALAAVPLAFEGLIIGALCLSFDAPRTFSPDEYVFMLTLASQCAQALERARLYAASQEAVRLRDRFLAAASHELRTPVAIVQGYIQNLDRQMARQLDTQAAAGADATGLVILEGARVRSKLRAIDDALHRLTSLVDKLLDITRILEEQPLPVHLETVDLVALLSAVAAEMRLRQARGTYPAAVPLQVMAPDREILGCWDRERIQQVLINVLDNALRYSETGGTVEVWLTEESNGAARYAHLAVHDQGQGMLPKQQAQAFEPFFRADSGETAGLPRLGISLAIGKHIVERHGGRIWVESAGPGRGSTLHILLPCLDARE